MPHLEFHGKQSVYAHHLSVPYRTLDIVRNKSILPRGAAAEEGNLIVHGDNLHALKALMPRYAGRVNCIYIDPPYNTGEEGWCYNDNVNSELMQRWLQENGAVDGEDEERHEKWLCMMWPRLQLLRELLTEDGVIFISIDDHEQHRLRMMMDDVFGEDSFLATFIWHHRKSSQNDIDVSLSHNYILCYSKDSEEFRFKREEIDESGFSNPDNDPRGTWKADPMDAPGVRENLSYPITNSKTGKVYFPPAGRHWRFSQDKYEEALADNRIVFGKRGTTKPQYKRFLFEAKEAGKNVFTIWSDVETATDATRQINQIFGEKNKFKTPKPVSLVKRILNISTGKNAIILDSFAGSGTTAHAVLELNKEDGGNRKFILVECEDYADEITAERVRRVINGVPNAKNGALKAGLGGTFAFCKLGRELDIEKILTGEDLPDYDALARHVSYTATGAALESIESGADHFFGENATHRMHMIYRPDVDFLCSNESAITRELAQRIGAAAKKAGKTALVFAPWKFISQKELTQNGVTFCQLPYAIHRMFGNSLGE
ncbi:MAG: site-specific DNA-methyltransferase [Deltaproteobacteria bacterium]|nr:site-specific DNA-methyltransferase [Deltaproteobacteria bacterium]